MDSEDLAEVLCCLAAISYLVLDCLELELKEIISPIDQHYTSISKGYSAERSHLVLFWNMVCCIILEGVISYNRVLVDFNLARILVDIGSAKVIGR